MRYEIVSAPTLRTMQMEIQRKLDAGWKLNGDLISYYNTEDESVFAHTMTLDMQKGNK